MLAWPKQVPNYQIHARSMSGNVVCAIIMIGWAYCLQLFSKKKSKYSAKQACIPFFQTHLFSLDEHSINLKSKAKLVKRNVG